MTAYCQVGLDVKDWFGPLAEVHQSREIGKKRGNADVKVQ